MNKIAYLQSLVTILLWSSLAWLVVGLSAVPPFLLLGGSLLIGSFFGTLKIRSWKVPLKTLAVGVCGIFSYHFFLFMAFRTAPAVEANLINYLWPLLIVVLSPVFLSGYRLQAKHIIGALLGFSGAFLIISGGKWGFDLRYLTGYALAMIAAFIWASYSLLTKRLPPFPSAAIGLFCFLSGVLSLGIHFVAEPAYVFKTNEYLYLILLGMGPLGLSFYCWDAALKKGDPRIIGSLSYLAPLLSTLVLVFTGVGHFTPVSFVAMLLIVGGAITGSTSWGKKDK